MGYFSSSEMFGGSPYIGKSDPQAIQFIRNLSGESVPFSQIGVQLLSLGSSSEKDEAINACVYQDDYVQRDGHVNWCPTSWLSMLQIMERRGATEYLLILPGGVTEVRTVTPDDLEEEREREQKREEEKERKEREFQERLRKERMSFEREERDRRESRRGLNLILPYRGISIRIEKVLGVNLDDSSQDIGVSKDGRRFRLEEKDGEWIILHEEKHFIFMESDKGISLSKMISQFISSQYQDGEEITQEVLVQDFRLSKSFSPLEGKKKWHPFQALFPRLSQKVEKRAEEALINLFCSTEGTDRVLVEQNGVFSWQKGSK